MLKGRVLGRSKHICFYSAESTQQILQHQRGRNNPPKKHKTQKKEKFKFKLIFKLLLVDIAASVCESQAENTASGILKSMLAIGHPGNNWPVSLFCNFFFSDIRKYSKLWTFSSLLKKKNTDRHKKFNYRNETILEGLRPHDVFFFFSLIIIIPRLVAQVPLASPVPFF